MSLKALALQEKTDLTQTLCPKPHVPVCINDRQSVWGCTPSAQAPGPGPAGLWCPGPPPSLSHTPLLGLPEASLLPTLPPPISPGIAGRPRGHGVAGSTQLQAVLCGQKESMTQFLSDHPSAHRAENDCFVMSHSLAAHEGLRDSWHFLHQRTSLKILRAGALKFCLPLLPVSDSLTGEAYGCQPSIPTPIARVCQPGLLFCSASQPHHHPCLLSSP